MNENATIVFPSTHVVFEGLNEPKENIDENEKTKARRRHLLMDKLRHKAVHGYYSQILLYTVDQPFSNVSTLSMIVLSPLFTSLLPTTVLIPDSNTCHGPMSSPV